VGDEWFTASAYAFLEENLPEDASLSAFGAAYPDFLATLPATADCENAWNLVPLGG